MIRIKQVGKHIWLTNLGRLKLLLEQKKYKVDRNDNHDTLFS